MTYAAGATWLRPRLWFALVVGAVTWVAWLASLAVGGWYKDAAGTLVGADHLAFYTAARFVYDGNPAGMYDYAGIHARQQELIGWKWVGIEGYRNPPFYALLYLPTAGMSYYMSLVVWTVIGLGLFLSAVYLLKPEHLGRTLAWAFAFYPIFATTSFGQNTFLSLAVFVGVYRLTEANRLFLAGLTAGLLWFKPPLLIGLFVWWGLAPRRFLSCWLGVGAAGLSLAAVSWLVLPEASWAFVDSLRLNVAYGGEGKWNKHTPKAFFEMLLPWWPGLVWALVLSLSAISVWRMRQFLLRTGSRVEAQFPVAIFLSLWVSPHALIYEWSLLVVAAVIVWERFPQSREAWLCLFVSAGVALMVSTPLTLLQLRTLGLPAAVQISIPLLGGIGLLTARELESISLSHT
jgi:hypothetical protein